jgi:hypothetical protein
MPIGRILKQPGVPAGRANWNWGVALPGRPQPAGHRGNCNDLEECKRRFKAVWAGIRSGLSESDIGAACRALNEARGAPRNGPVGSRNIFSRQRLIPQHQLEGANP